MLVLMGDNGEGFINLRIPGHAGRDGVAPLRLREKLLSSETLPPYMTHNKPLDRAQIRRRTTHRRLPRPLRHRIHLRSTHRRHPTQQSPHMVPGLLPARIRPVHRILRQAGWFRLRPRRRRKNRRIQRLWPRSHPRLPTSPQQFLARLSDSGDTGNHSISDWL